MKIINDNPHIVPVIQLTEEELRGNFVQVDIVDKKGRIARAFVSAKPTRTGIRLNLYAMKNGPYGRDASVSAVANYRQPPED